MGRTSPSRTKPVRRESAPLLSRRAAPTPISRPAALTNSCFRTGPEAQRAPDPIVGVAQPVRRVQDEPADAEDEGAEDEAASIAVPRSVDMPGGGVLPLHDITMPDRTRAGNRVTRWVLQAQLEACIYGCDGSVRAPRRDTTDRPPAPQLTRLAPADRGDVQMLAALQPSRNCSVRR